VQKWLESQDRPVKLGDLDAAGATLRLFAAIARLRRLGPTAVDGFRDEIKTSNGLSADFLVSTDVRNIEGLFTNDELATFLNGLLDPKPPLPPTTHWSETIVNGLKDRIQDSVAKCIELGSLPADNSSIAIVDEGLRSLLAYNASGPWLDTRQKS
jgi:hypothetical protein